MKATWVVPGSDKLKRDVMGIGIVRFIESIFRGDDSSPLEEGKGRTFTSIVYKDQEVAFEGNFTALDQKYRKKFEEDVAEYQRIVS